MATPTCGICTAAVAPGARHCPRCGTALSPPGTWPLLPVPGLLVPPPDPPLPPEPERWFGASQARALAAVIAAILVIGSVAVAANRDSDGFRPSSTTTSTTPASTTSTTAPTSSTTAEIEVPPLVEVWRYDTQGTHAEGLTNDGNLVYGATRSGRVFALDPARGTPVWVTELGLDLEVAPEPGTGIVVVTGDDNDHGFLVALDAVTGQERWRTSLPTTAAVARPTVLGGSVFLSLTDLVAFDAATGQEQWRRFDGIGATEPFPASDTVTDGSRLFLAVEVWDGGTSYHKEIRAIDPATGIDLWAVLAGRGLPEPRLLDGVVAFFVADAAGAAAQLVAVDPNEGRELWRSRTLDAFGVPAAATGGIVVQQTTSLVAVDTGTGQPLWEVPALAYTSPAASADRVFYVDIELTALDATTGAVVARSQFDAFVDHPPSIAGDLLLLQDAFGVVIAYRVP